MKRSVTSIALLVLTAGVLTPVASAAAPPDPVDQTQTFEAGDACPFPIEVAFAGKGGNIDLPNNPNFSGMATSPDLRVTVTNLSDPSKTVTINATGVFRYTLLPDGSVNIVAGGHNFLYGVPEVGATALATTGPIKVQVVNDDIAEMDLSGARVRDICAELA
jgi:hypothetical protein